jgi:hypothetical protein
LTRRKDYVERYGPALIESKAYQAADDDLKAMMLKRLADRTNELANERDPDLGKLDADAIATGIRKSEKEISSSNSRESQQPGRTLPRTMQIHRGWATLQAGARHLRAKSKWAGKCKLFEQTLFMKTKSNPAVHSPKHVAFTFSFRDNESDLLVVCEPKFNAIDTVASFIINEVDVKRWARCWISDPVWGLNKKSRRSVTGRRSTKSKLFVLEEWMNQEGGRGQRFAKLNASPNASPKGKGSLLAPYKWLILKVGTAGFEPTASCTPSKRATRLRHVPDISIASRFEAG